MNSATKVAGFGLRVWEAFNMGFLGFGALLDGSYRISIS